MNTEKSADHGFSNSSRNARVPAGPLTARMKPFPVSTVS